MPKLEEKRMKAKPETLKSAQKVMALNIRKNQRFEISS